MPIANLLPIPSFDMTFKGKGPGAAPPGTNNEMTFKAVESKDSRNLGYGYELVYHVFADPPNDILFTDHIWTAAERADWAWGSDEVVIGWNTWLKAGWSFFDKMLVKKWPPECTRLSHNDYRVAIKYSPLYIIDFQTTPQKVKKLSSYAVAAYDFPAEGGNPNLINMQALSEKDFEPYLFINVDKKGKVQGVDVFEPSFTWTERWTWGPVKDLYHPLKAGGAYHYFKRLAELTATTNVEEFRGLPNKCVLFCGAVGRYIGPMTWEIDYRFSYRPTEEYKEVHGYILPIPKPLQSGWTFIDIEGSETIETTRGDDERKYVVQKPTLVKMHRVYKESNFAELNIYEKIPLGDAQVWEHSSLADSPPQLGPVWHCPMPDPPFVL